MTIPMLLRKVLTEDLCEYNYFITPERGGVQLACRCFVTVTVSKLSPDRQYCYYKCNLFSSLN